MLNRAKVVSCISAVYGKAGNGEKVCNEVLTAWVEDVCNPEFKQAFGMSPLYDGEWYWGGEQQVTEILAEVNLLDSALDDELQHDFAAVAEFVKWGFIYQQLVELNQLARVRGQGGVSCLG